MRVAILQSNYIPWKGYFDIIHDVDLFLFYDDLQYTKNDWRNRNRIKTKDGTQWLTIPVGKREHRRICDVALPDDGWRQVHWQRLQDAYRRAPYFSYYRPWLEEVYLRRRWTTLAGLNQTLIVEIARDLLGIRTAFGDSRAFGLTARKGDRVIELLRAVGADAYVSGPAAREYLDETACQRAGIAITWKDYGGYPEYEQMHPPFDPRVSVLDLLLHTGPDAAWHIWGWRQSMREEQVA